MNQGIQSRALYVVLPKGSTTSRNWSQSASGQPAIWHEISSNEVTDCPARLWRDGATIYEVELREGTAVDTMQARPVRRFRPQELEQLNIFTSGSHEANSGVLAVSGSAILEALGDVEVYACGDSQTSCRNSAVVHANGCAKVKAYDGSVVHALGSSKVEGYDRSRIYAAEDTIIHAHGRCRVEAKAHARVFAFDQSKVVGEDGVTIRAFKRSGITARGSCKVYTFDDAKAWLHDNVTAWADGTSLIFAADSVLVHRKNAAAQVHPLHVVTI